MSYIQTPLFENCRYPDATPFRKDSNTSKAAADKIDSKILRELCVEQLKMHGPMTPDECAERMNRNPLSIRPRFTQLKSLGRITNTGERRPSSTGSDMAVMRLNA